MWLAWQQWCSRSLHQVSGSIKSSVTGLLTGGAARYSTGDITAEEPAAAGGEQLAQRKTSQPGEVHAHKHVKPHSQPLACWCLFHVFNQEDGGCGCRNWDVVSSSLLEGGDCPACAAAAGGEDTRVQCPVQTAAANSGWHTERGVCPRCSLCPEHFLQWVLTSSLCFSSKVLMIIPIIRRKRRKLNSYAMFNCSYLSCNAGQLKVMKARLKRCVLSREMFIVCCHFFVEQRLTTFWFFFSFWPMLIAKAFGNLQCQLP